MKPILTACIAIFAAVALVGITSVIAGPGGRLSASDLDEPVSSFEASSAENNNSSENNDNNTPGENNDPPPPEVFGEPVPGKKILFVLDRTCSMGTTPLQRMKDEVNAALDALKANNDTLKAQWQAGGSVGPEPKIEFALVRFNTSAQHWQGSLVEASAGNVAGGKSWVNSLYKSGSTSWTAGFQRAQTFGGVFDTVFFLSDGRPNHAQPWDPHADALANLYLSKTDGMRFIAQYFFTGSTSGQSEMQRCATRMDGKPNITGVFSSVS